MNTSKVKYLVIISSLIAILFPLVNIYYILPAFKDVIIHNSEHDAERIVNFFARTIVSDGRILNNLEEHRERLEELKEPLNVTKLKFFSPDGTTIYSSDRADIGLVNSKDYFHQLVAKGKKFTNVIALFGAFERSKFHSLPLLENSVCIVVCLPLIGYSAAVITPYLE